MSLRCGVLLLQGAVKVMAKDLVRTRHQIEKFYKLKSQLQGVSLRIQVEFVSPFVQDHYVRTYCTRNILNFVQHFIYYEWQLL